MRIALPVIVIGAVLGGAMQQMTAHGHPVWALLILALVLAADIGGMVWLAGAERRNGMRITVFGRRRQIRVDNEWVDVR